jgi:hypothetical protein
MLSSLGLPSRLDQRPGAEQRVAAMSNMQTVSQGGELVVLGEPGRYPLQELFVATTAEPAKGLDRTAHGESGYNI